MLSQVKELLLGPNVGATHKEYLRLIERDRLSGFLPWLSCDEETGEYALMDNSLGYMWEITPAYFMDASMSLAYQNLLKIDLPKRSVIQFILYPDHALHDLVDFYRDSKVRDSELLKHSIDQRVRWMKQSALGISAMQGIPLRQFRAYVTLKVYEPIASETITTFEQSLKATGSHPRRVMSRQLMHWMRQIFNGFTEKQPVTVDPGRPLSEQLIKADSVIESVNRNTLKIGDWYGKCLTPKQAPENRTIDPLKVNRLSGGWSGISDDDNQIKGPFLWTLTILVEDNRTALKYKADITLAQKATGRIATVIQKRVEEFIWATSKMDDEPFYAVIPQLWVFGKDQESVDTSASKASSLWSGMGFEMQTETLLRQALLITALPFGYYNINNNTVVLDREFYQPVSTIARLLPIQADFKQPSRPISINIGRKGEPICLDINNPQAPNQNGIIGANSGSGKTFFLQSITNDHYAAGDLLRAVDIGYGLERSCRINNGRFIDFGKERVVMNPFNFTQHQDDNDIKGNRNAAKLILAEMVYSCSGQVLSEVEWTLLADAVEWVDREGRHDDGIDSVCEYLRRYPHFLSSHQEDYQFAAPVAKAMAFNLRKFGREGVYGHYFNGRSTFNIESDEYVVLELDVLKGIPDLFGVVIMQVMNAITQDLYLSARDRRRFILFEEAAHYLKQHGHKDLTRLAGMIEEGYRRARKYKGSFFIVLQSMLDLGLMGPLGKVLFENAAYKFMLQGSSYGEAVEQGILDYDEFTTELLKSVRLNSGRYSEAFIDSPFGRGVARCVVDPWNYWLMTSNADETHAYDELISRGLTPVEAINQLSGVGCG